ncbi:MAG: radical SAM protein [bacterium]|nr:radical SAM protein [bacterium]
MEFDLPKEPPRNTNGVKCNICMNGCQIPEGGKGYCGLRTNQGGKLAGVGKKEANLDWYHDPLPTNCVADWVCPGGTDVGYPEFSYSPGPEYGYRNLAVFYNGCSFNCLFCQNWHYRQRLKRTQRLSPEELAGYVDLKTSCICYFGGDPTPQLPHSLEVSRIAIEQNKDRVLRICWETNGTMNPRLLEEMVEVSLRSGGCIKFDLKAWTEELNIALCGRSNKRTLSNFKLVAQKMKLRPDPPLLIASTLLVPGYVDASEVTKIAGFIASLDPKIPYSLLGFYPHFYMRDLPTTSKRHAEDALRRAQTEGLEKVRIGNIHLLGDAY